MNQDPRGRRALTVAMGAAMAACALLALSTPARADEEDGLRVQLEPMYMSVYGNDVHAANVSVIDFSSIPIQEAESGVDLELDETFAFRGEVELVKNQWGWGVSGWWFDTDGDETTGPLNADLASGIDVFVFAETVGFEFAPDIGLGDLTFSAEQDLEVWNLDVYAVRTLAEKPNSHLDMTAGLKIGEISNCRRDILINTESAETRQHLSELDADVMAGPGFALRGHATSGKHRFEGFISQAVIFGDVDHIAAFERQFAGSPVEQTAFLKSETVAIPITEIRFKWLHVTNDRFSVGVGLFASTWWDAPVAPIGSTPAVFPTLQENTISFVGGIVGLAFRVQ